MYILYNVNNKKKSNIKGYWKNENNKLYIDNIHLEYFMQKEMLKNKIVSLFNKGEEAVFYIDKKIKGLKSEVAISTILNKDNTKINLKKCITLQYAKNIDIDNTIIDLLLKYNGFTVFEKENKYIIEIWS